MARQEHLEGLYPGIFESDELRRNLAQVFKHVRIMVVGKSGSGKSTLIRLVIGEKGPRCIRDDGRAGDQDINVEWPHPDPDLPLVFHDSNGMDVEGRSRLEVIRAFLNKHQKSADHSQRIHLVWYVVSASDTRLATDGGLLQMLDKDYPDLPLLLVMTFNDNEKAVKKNIDNPNSGFETLLQSSISDPGKRKRARDRMVRLGNDVEQMEDGSIKGEQDLEGLKLLTKRTKDLMGEEFHATWIAAQVSDLDAKLEASAACIIKLRRMEVLTTIVMGAIPGAQQAQLVGMLQAVQRSLCKMWRVPRNLEAAIGKEMPLTRGVLENVGYDVGVAVGLAGGLVLTILTAGAGGSVLLGLYGAAAYAQAKAASALFMSVSLLCLGIILDAKSRQPIQHWNSWNHLHSEDHYRVLCRAFPTSPPGLELTSFLATDPVSSHISPFKSFAHQCDYLKARLVDFFQEIAVSRQTSLRSVMQSDHQHHHHHHHQS